ncbi:hypothetical protein [Lysobacter arvi]|uniref:Uncharacterized protein n=1 Tax=Lysobacter arvi TaxID=3038776 RepID=A0ABU1C9I8_9GAMM|nr:hypothetical protein [Lysobacter arvi]MDR0181765.1 hypothetical protein [Lysobacter arvi]
MNRIFRSLALLLLPLMMAAGCTGKQDAALLAAPQVGDLYAAELSHFAEFDQAGKAYGLMKVVKVDGDAVTVITDSSAWEAPSGANNDLHGDLSAIKWDTEDELRIARSELSSLYGQDKIFGVRRMALEAKP